MEASEYSYNDFRCSHSIQTNKKESQPKYKNTESNHTVNKKDLDLDFLIWKLNDSLQFRAKYDMHFQHGPIKSIKWLLRFLVSMLFLILPS